MIRVTILSAVAAVAFAGAAEAGKSKCFVTSAQGVGATKEIADSLSKTALATALTTNAVKGKGKVTTKCEGAFPVVTCKSSQRSCK